MVAFRTQSIVIVGMPCSLQNNWNALMVCASWNHVDVLSWLWENFGGSFKIDALNNVREALFRSTLELLELQVGSVFLEAVQVGLTAAHQAARDDHLEALQFLVLTCGADVNVKTVATGSNVFAIACMHGSLRVVKWMIALGSAVPRLRVHTPCTRVCRWCDCTCLLPL